MESQKIPFISAHEPPSQSQRPVKQYRPVLTRPWVLWVFVAATSVCLGLLVAISQVERRTSLNRKRDMDDSSRRQSLFGRQDQSPSATPTIGYTTFSSAVLSLTAQATDATTSEAPTSQCSVTVEVTVWDVQATGTLPEFHSTTTVFPENSADGCSSVTKTIYQTSLLLSLTSQNPSETDSIKPIFTGSASTSAVLSLTSQSSSDTSSISLIPTASASSSDVLSLTVQSSSSTTSVVPIASTSAVLSLTSQSSSDTRTIAATATSSAILSLTPKPTVETSSEPLVVSDASAAVTFSAADPTLASSGSEILSLIPSTQSKASPSGIATIESFLRPSISTTKTVATTARFIVASTLTSPTAPTESLDEALVSNETGQGASLATSSSMPTHSANTATGPSAGSNNDTKLVDPIVNADLFLIEVATFKNYYYFFAMYLPKIIAVVMSTMWGIIFANLKLIEPFYQLSAHSGAFAKDAMFGNYLSTALSPSSLSAASRGQWVLILGGMILLAWLVVVALVSEVMTVISTGNCIGADGTSFRCAPGWAVNRPVLNMLIGVVGLIFILVLILTWLISRRNRSGLFVDPSSIASMAELLGNPAVMHDLREVDPLASDTDAKTLLGENRYRLGFYNVATGKQSYDSLGEEDSNERYGLVKIAGDPMPQKLAYGRQTGYGAVPNSTSRQADASKANVMRRILQLILDIIMLLTIIAIFIVVLYYYLDDKSDPLNNFFNSNSFGPRFVLTGLSLIVTIGWSRTSQEVTLMAPYRNMARAMYAPSGVSARRSILAPIPCNPFAAAYNGLLLRNYIVTAVAFSAILGDILLIAVSGVPFSAGQILPSLQASSFTSLAILGIMAMTSVAVIVHHRTSAGGTRRLPRSPDTLVAVWLYLCGSELAQHDKQGYDEQPGMPLDEAGLKAKYTGHQYGFAFAKGVDGVSRWTVDESAELHSAKAATTDQQTQYRPCQPQADPDAYLYAASEYSSESNPCTQARHSGVLDPSTHRHDVRSQGSHQPFPPHQHLDDAQAASPFVQSESRRFEQLRPRDYSLSQQYGTPQDYRVVRSQLRYSTGGPQQQMQSRTQYSRAASGANDEAGSNGVQSHLYEHGEHHRTRR